LAKDTGKVIYFRCITTMTRVPSRFSVPVRVVPVESRVPSSSTGQFPTVTGSFSSVETNVEMSNNRNARPQRTQRTSRVFGTSLALVSPWKKWTNHALVGEPANGDEDQKYVAAVAGKAVGSIDGFDCE